MFQLGMPTLIELPDLEDCAKLCFDLGLKFIELNMCLPQYQIETIDIEKLKEISEKYNIYYTFHLDDTNTPCDFNPKIAKAYKETVVETIDIAKKLNSPVLNMHLSVGTHFTLPERKVLLFEEYKDIYFDKLVSFRDECQKTIGDSNIKICIENTRAFTHPLIQGSLSLLLESPAFALTFDTGHDASNNYSQRPVIDKHIDRLSHIHLHDAIISEHRDHLPIGDGELNIKDYLELSSCHNCRVVVEVKTIDGLNRSVNLIRNNYVLNNSANVN